VWNKRFPLAKQTAIYGDPGGGKTTLVLDVQAHVTTGKPFCDGALCARGEVLFATAEDGIADTIRPRMEKLGADLTRVHVLDMVRANGKETGFDLSTHLDPLDRWLAHRPGVRVVGLDPLAAFLGDVDAHRNNEVRELLGALAKLAEERRVALIAIDHLNKAQGKAMHRGIGSIAFTAAPRAVWQVVADPDDEGRSLFLPVKMNLARVDGLAFRLKDGGLIWEPNPVKLRPDDISPEAAGGSPRDEAKAWLRDVLKKGPRAAQEIENRAKDDGICLRTLKSAKKEMGVASERHNDKWSWVLPKGAKP